MVCEHHDVIRDTVVSSLMQGPAVPGRGADSAPAAGAVVSMDLATERENLMAAWLPINVVARGLYALKWRI